MQQNGVRNMKNKYWYKAFGLNIVSEIAIAQVPVIEAEKNADVTIKISDLSKVSFDRDEYFRITEMEIVFSIGDLAKFRITNANMIEVDPVQDCNDSRLGVYLMGSCMGAVLHQKGQFLFHGSCVTNGERAILITGDSGAGKSTLAAEFLAHGWKLVTDDVAVIKNIETIPVVQSSYPSQKLWQDSLEHYERKKEDIHSLYFEDTREKFGINVSEFFADGCYPLKLVVRLACAENFPCHIQPIEDMAKVNQFRVNTYRLMMVEPEKQQEHFSRCVMLANKVQMALVLREQGKSCATELYEMIIKYYS